jgi:hypothetical protein
LSFLCVWENGEDSVQGKKKKKGGDGGRDDQRVFRNFVFYPHFVFSLGRSHFYLHFLFLLLYPTRSGRFEHGYQVHFLSAGEAVNLIILAAHFFIIRVIF